MVSKKLGGNPTDDKKASVERFNNFVYPVLSNVGFRKIDKRGHRMVNTESRTIIIPKSCPSDVKHSREIQQLTRELLKKYEGYSVYILFHRNKEEWADKPVYANVLRSIMKNQKIKGVICGLDYLVYSLNDMVAGKLTYKI
jgi:hypothetical protein